MPVWLFLLLLPLPFFEEARPKIPGKGFPTQDTTQENYTYQIAAYNKGYKTYMGKKASVKTFDCWPVHKST
eukprot:1148493-Pelagomonas_calceolata.AAC.3